MNRDDAPNGRCTICKRAYPLSALVPATRVRPSLQILIKEQVPDWLQRDFICLNDLHHFRLAYLENLLEQERQELADLSTKTPPEDGFSAANLNEQFETRLTFGQRTADAIARVGGSWGFIITFFAVLGGWIAVNSAALLGKPFDPFPFILLNLVLSCLAAIQAPIIMMSQNRQSAKDRLDADNDYRVNLEAELDIKLLQKKLDYLLTRRWEHLLEVQALLLESLSERSPQATREEEP